MKEIKFRAWDKVDKKVKKVMSLDFYNTRQSEVTLASDGDVYLTYFEQIELMQYTGLKDINGKEIYEGDIIRYPAKDSWENENFISYIVWFDNRVEWGIGYKLRAHFHGVLCGGHVETNLKNANKMLIRGNVFENSELMKGRQ